MSKRRRHALTRADALVKADGDGGRITVFRGDSSHKRPPRVSLSTMKKVLTTAYAAPDAKHFTRFSNFRMLQVKE